MDNNLPGDYIAGFVDGEGCFYLTFRSEVKRNRNGSPTYYRWLPYFAITLREDDYDILKKICDTLNCGKLYFLSSRNRGGRMAYLGIQNITDLYEKVMPFFKKYPLRAKKRKDFELWCRALEIVYRNKKNRASHSIEDHRILSNIREGMRTYKSKLDREYKNKPLI